MASSSLDATNVSGTSTLHVLAGSGCSEGVALLLEHGADANLRGANGRRPLHACGLGAEERDDDLDSAFSSCVELLVRFGAEIDALDDDGSTALALAGSKGKLGCVKALLDSGARVGLGADRRGNTPLHLAAANRHVSCLALLLDAAARQSGGGAPPVQPARTDDDVATSAATSAAVAIYEKLRAGRKKKVVEDQWVECHTESSEIYYYNARTEATSWTLPVVVSQPATGGPDRLRAAATDLDCEAIAAVLGSGVDPDLVLDAATGQTALHLCARRHKRAELAAAAVAVLADFGATLDARDALGDSPLHVSASNGGDRVLEALLAAGADVAAANNQGDTALHVAVWHRRAASCRLLRSYGAPDARNGKGRTPLEHARARLLRDERRQRSPSSGAGSGSPSSPRAGSPRSPPRGSSPREEANAVLALLENDIVKSPKQEKPQQDDAGAPDDFPTPEEEGDDEMLDDELFFDALISPPAVEEPAVERDTEAAQGFRDPLEEQGGCSGSVNPFYISSPTAASPHYLAGPASPVGGAKTRIGNAGVQSDLDRYQQQNGSRRSSPSNWSGSSSPVAAAGDAAPDLILGLERARRAAAVASSSSPSSSSPSSGEGPS